MPILIDQNPPISTYTSLNLLAHAQLEELDVGSRCGGHGVCGGDRVRVSCEEREVNLSPITQAEREHLSASELEQGWRLACQCYPNSDALEIRVETRDGSRTQSPTP